MTKVILIVDDEPSNIDVVKGLLSQQYKCKAAIEGGIALRQIAKQKPDMLILDLIMPEMDGIETLTEVRKTYSQSELPVLIVSGTKEPEQLAILKKLGISEFMTKPINGPQFQKLVAQTVGGH